MSVLVEATQAPVPDDGLVRDFAAPDLGVATHRMYMLQWYTFAALALAKLGVTGFKVAFALLDAGVRVVSAEYLQGSIGIYVVAIEIPAATAASMALPPAFRMSSPAWAARGWLVATMPRSVITTERRTQAFNPSRLGATPR